MLEDPDELVPLSTIENQYIQHVLKVTKQNRTSAAKINLVWTVKHYTEN